MDETQLFQEYKKTHDVKLRNEIAEKYLFIASMIAKKFVGRGVEYDDLFQVASLALLKGIDRFDETKGLKFSTFITPTITGEIKNYFRDRSRLIHLPRRVAELRVSVKKAEEELTLENGKSPTAKEIAEKLGVPPSSASTCTRQRHSGVKTACTCKAIRHSPAFTGQGRKPGEAFSAVI